MTNKIFKLSPLLMAGALVLGTACSEDDNNNNNTTPTTGNVVKSGQITADETWTADKVYQLSGRVVVTNGATLTIQPGTIIKGEAGQEANASALIIARGAMIDAVGTPTQPIIFTSVADEIMPGETVSPNLNASFSGLWGGVIILGNARISAEGDVESLQIEGIPPSDPNGLYGGTNDDDNSGKFQYVSIRHGGTLIGDGNEINGLTLGGVGRQTTISHVEVVANVDDGIEWFGGSVNSSNLLVWFQGDDAFDVDQAYSGTINNLIAIHNNSADHALEIDGPEGSLNGGFTMTNGTFVGWNDGGVDGGEYADFRDGAQGTLSNLYFTNFSESSDVELDDDVSSQNYTNGLLNFNAAWQFNTAHLSNGNMDVTDIFSDRSSLGNAFSDLSFSSNVSTPTVGADASAFTGWTWGDAIGALDNL